MLLEGFFPEGVLPGFLVWAVNFVHLSLAVVMTRGGMGVRHAILAVEALNLIQSRHITSVMVADGDHLLGVLHMHDLLRAGVV